MVIRRLSPTVLELHDRPGCFWLLGLFFVAGGTMLLYGVAGGFTNSDSLSLVGKVLASVIAFAHISAGVYIIRRSPQSQVHIDLARGTVVIRRTGLLLHSTREVRIGEIRYVGLGTSEDTDGDPVYRPVIRLASGEEIALSHLWIHDLPGLESTVAETGAFLAGDQPGERYV